MQGAFEITPGLVASPFRFLWHCASRTAILADLHLGAEKTLARQGIFLPDVSTGAIVRAWREVMALGPARVILAGDVFDSPEHFERGALVELLDLQPRGCRVMVTPGNHDPEADVILAAFPGVAVEPFVRVEGFTVTHGHVIPPGPHAGLIVGHQHPAVTVATRVRSAKMICFALARVAIGDGAAIPMVVLPAFSPLPLGSNLLTERYWILDCARPKAADVRIAGIVEKAGDPLVLDFGPLDQLL